MPSTPNFRFAAFKGFSDSICLHKKTRIACGTGFHWGRTEPITLAGDQHWHSGPKQQASILNGRTQFHPSTNLQPLKENLSFAIGSKHKKHRCDFLRAAPTPLVHRPRQEEPDQVDFSSIHGNSFGYFTTGRKRRKTEVPVLDIKIIVVCFTSSKCAGIQNQWFQILNTIRKSQTPKSKVPSQKVAKWTSKLFRAFSGSRGFPSFHLLNLVDSSISMLPHAILKSLDCYG